MLVGKSPVQTQGECDLSRSASAPVAALAVKTPKPYVATDAVPSAYNSTKKNTDALPETPAGFWETGANVNDDDDF